MTGNGILEQNSDEIRNLPITVELWARLHSSAAFNILIACDPTISSTHWEIYTLPGNGALVANLSGKFDAISNTNICDDAWHYIAVTFDAAAIKVYVDGKQQDQQVVEDHRATGLHLGKLAIGQTVEGDVLCNGLIEDVRISRGLRPITDASPGRFERDDQTLALWLN